MANDITGTPSTTKAFTSRSLESLKRKLPSDSWIRKIWLDRMPLLLFPMGLSCQNHLTGNVLTSSLLSLTKNEHSRDIGLPCFTWITRQEEEDPCLESGTILGGQRKESRSVSKQKSRKNKESLEIVIMLWEQYCYVVSNHYKTWKIIRICMKHITWLQYKETRLDFTPNVTKESHLFLLQVKPTNDSVCHIIPLSVV